MSGAFARGSLKPEVVIDPSMIFHSNGIFDVPVGNKIYNPTVVKTTNTATNGGVINFTAAPGSIKFGMGRDVFIRARFKVVIRGKVKAGSLALGFQGAAAGKSWAAFPGITDAPRAFPLSMITQNIQVTINNSTVTLLTSQLLPAFLCCNLDNMITSKELSDAPSALDMTQEYEDCNILYSGVPVTPQAPVMNITGTINSPLTSLGGTVSKYSPPRGSWPLEIDPNPLNTFAEVPGNIAQTTLYFETYEPLWVSPFGSGTSQKLSLIGLNSFNVQLNIAQMYRVWSHNNEGLISTDIDPLTALDPSVGVQVTFDGNPELHLKYFTPSDAIHIPERIIYPYTSVLPSTTSNGTATVLPGAILTLNSQNQQLSSIPSRIIVFGYQNIDTWSASTSDTFLGIDGISVNFDNLTGIFATASSQDLWRMSRDNGLEMTYQEWITRGAILIFDVTKNLCLPNRDEAPSIQMQKNFQITVRFKNLSRFPKTVTMQVVVMNSGIITIQGGNSTMQDSVLTTSDVSHALHSAVRRTSMPPADFYGAGLVPKRRGESAGFSPMSKARKRDRSPSSEMRIPKQIGWKPNSAFDDPRGGQLASKRDLKNIIDDVDE